MWENWKCKQGYLKIIKDSVWLNVDKIKHLAVWLKYKIRLIKGKCKQGDKI